MDDQSRARLLDDSVSLERELLERIDELLGQPSEDSEYREVIERHRRVLEEAVAQIEGAIRGILLEGQSVTGTPGQMTLRSLLQLS